VSKFRRERDRCCFTRARGRVFLADLRLRRVRRDRETVFMRRARRKTPTACMGPWPGKYPCGLPIDLPFRLAFVFRLKGCPL
jgi:hypothetical protein